MNKFSDSDMRDYATKVLHLLNEQRKYFRQKSQAQLEKCKKLERDLFKLTEGILGEFQQLRIFGDQPATLPD